MRPLIAILLISVAFAGCTEDAPAAAPDDGTKDATVSSDTGAISGVVVDSGVMPIEGVAISLMGTEATTISNELGQFVFEDLEPKLYFLQLEAEGYETMQSQASVVAGEIAKPRVTLPYDLTPQPYAETVDFKGHMVVSDFFVIYVLTGITGDESMCECNFEFTSNKDVQTIVVDGSWDSSYDRVEEHDMYWDLWGGDGHDSAWTTSREPWHAAGATYGSEVTEWELQVSSGEQPDVEQGIEGFVTFWYVEPAPAGWSFIDE